MTRLPAGESSTSIPASTSSSPSVSRSRLCPPGKSVEATSANCAGRRRRSRRSGARPSRSTRRAGAQLVERAVEVLALGAQLRKALLLRGVFLLRERIDTAELLAAPLEPLQLLGEPPVRPRRSGAGGVETALGLVRSASNRRPRRRRPPPAPPPPSARRGAPLAAAESAQLGGELEGGRRRDRPRRASAPGAARPRGALQRATRAASRLRRRAPGRPAAARPARPPPSAPPPRRAAAGAEPPARAAPPRPCHP